MALSSLGDFGLTGFIDFSDVSKGTVDSANRVSAWQDSLALLNNFTQGTDANKPFLTGTSNKENLVFDSEDMESTSYWIHQDISISNAAITVDGIDFASITASAGSSVKYPYPNASARPNFYLGQSYTMSCLAKAGTHSYLQLVLPAGAFSLQSFQNFDLSTGEFGTGGTDVTSKKITAMGNGVYYISISAVCIATQGQGYFLSAMVPSASATRLEALNAAGTEVFYVARPQGRRSFTSDEYVSTTNNRTYAGANGRNAVHFDGAQQLSSTSTLANVFTSSSKLLYLVLRSDLLNSAQSIWNPGSQYLTGNIKATDSALQMSNYAGGAYQRTEIGLTVNQVSIVRVRHTGGTMYIAVDVGAGFSAEASVVSGNTDLMTGALSLGATTSGFYGDLIAIATANTGLAKPNLETLLRQEFMAKSLLRFDPINGLHINRLNN